VPQAEKQGLAPVFVLRIENKLKREENQLAKKIIQVDFCP